jgi:hypothetical protein
MRKITVKDKKNANQPDAGTSLLKQVICVTFLGSHSEKNTLHPAYFMLLL